MQIIGVPSRYYPGNLSKKDVEFKLNHELKNVKIGDPFLITVNVENKSIETRTININLYATSSYYNGIGAHFIKSVQKEFVLKPSESNLFKLTKVPDRNSIRAFRTISRRSEMCFRTNTKNVLSLV